MHHFVGSVRQRLQPAVDGAGLHRGWLAAAVVLLVAAGLLVAISPPTLVVAGFAALAAGALFIEPRLAFALTTCFLVLQYPALNLTEEGSWPYRMLKHADEVLFLGLAVRAWLGRGESRLPVDCRRSLQLLGVALLVGLVSALSNSSASPAIALDAISLSKGFLVLLAASLLSPTAEQAMRWTRWATWGSILLLAFGLVDMILPQLTHEWLPLAGPIRYRAGQRCLVSVFANEGMSGWFFAAAACLPLARYLVLRRRLDLLLSAALVLGSLLSYRRKPVIGLLVALALTFALRGDLRTRTRVLAAGLALVLLFLPLVGGTFGTIFSDAFDHYVTPVDPMRVARNALYIGGWQIAVDHFPLGAGLGMYGGHASAIYYSEFYVEYGLHRVWGLTPESPRFVNDAFFAHVLGALGLLGALCYLLALIWPLRALVRSLRLPTSPPVDALVTAALLVSFEALVEAIVAPVYETSLSSFAVFALIGLAISVRTAEPTAAATTR